jgi:hypothetical protein
MKYKTRTDSTAIEIKVTYFAVVHAASVICPPQIQADREDMKDKLT